MAIDQWQLSTYEQAAVQMAYRLNENPFEPMDNMNPYSLPRWTGYARRMAEHDLMVRCMREYGFQV